MRKEKFNRIAPTHFGIFDDPKWQLDQVEKELNAAEKWLEAVMPAEPSVEELRQQFTDWMNEQGVAQGLSAEAVKAYAFGEPAGHERGWIVEVLEESENGGVKAISVS